MPQRCVRLFMSLVLSLGNGLEFMSRRTALASSLTTGAASALSAPVNDLRPVTGLEGCTLPEWLFGDWTVRASKLEAVKFLGKKVSNRMPGARMGSCLALPNVGATPKNYVQRFPNDDFSNEKDRLRAFWDAPQNIQINIFSPTRYTMSYDAPTVSKGLQTQRADIEIRARHCQQPTTTSFLTTEHIAQANTLQDSTMGGEGTFGEYSTYTLFELLDTDTVKQRLRVAVFPFDSDRLLFSKSSSNQFNDRATIADPQPLAVYDYSFLLYKRRE